MNKSIKGKIQLNSFDDLLGVNKDEVVELPINQLFPFKNHPFQVTDDEKMQELVESIQQKGVLSPAIVRKLDDYGYEIISGHRRKRACEIAGLLTMPVIVKELSDEEATILMVDANIQRENVLPSERAHAYKMKMDVQKQQGKRTDLTSDQIGPKLTAQLIGEESGVSKTKVKNYIRLNFLLPELLKLVDERKLGFIPAVELSFLKKNEQEWVLKVINESGRGVSVNAATTLHLNSKNKTISEDLVCETILGRKTVSRTVTLREKDLREYFPDSWDSDRIKIQIIKILDAWKGEEDG